MTVNAENRPAAAHGAPSTVGPPPAVGRPLRSLRSVPLDAAPGTGRAQPSGNDDEDKVVTRSVRWRNEATSLHTERGVQELTDAFRTLVSDERLAGVQSPHRAGRRVLRDARHHRPDRRCPPRIRRAGRTQPALPDARPGPQGAGRQHSAARRPPSICAAWPWPTNGRWIC